METLTRARRIGGSLVVTIPKELVREENIKDGELVELGIKKVKKSGFGLLRRIGRFSKKDELDTEL